MSLVETKNDQTLDLRDTRERHLTMVDLFAGCGGLGLGMENAGFTTVFVNELNADAMDTYLRNRTHELDGIPFSELDDLHCFDANELNPKRLDRLKSDLETLPNGIEFGPKETSTLDLVAGGPPCQGFSGIGHRRSYSVDKADLPSNHLLSLIHI